MLERLKMPKNWDDHDEWENYYKQFPENKIFKDVHFYHDLSVQYLGYFLSKNFNRIWFPGCGLSLAPYTYQRFGFKVWATDVSFSAIEKQKSLTSDCLSEPKIKEIIGSVLKEKEFTPSTELHFSVHDFRTPFPEGDFDCVVNTKSFQALPQESMEKAAIVHYQALKSGGVAVFETMNVQGERRDLLENSLAEAGFYLPYHKAQKWHREVLKATGIPFIFILGNPTIPAWAKGYDGFWGKRKFKKDMKKLHSYTEGYKQRCQDEIEEAKTKESDGITKIAHVVYNTG